MTYPTLFFHKNRYQTFLTLLLLCLLAFGSYTTEAEDLAWAKRAGSSVFEAGNAIGVDSSGNTYVTGSYGREESSFTDPIIFGPGETRETTLEIQADTAYMFLAKYASNGNLVWAKRDGVGNITRAFDLAVDSSGNTYVTGFFDSSVNTIFGPNETNETTLTRNNDGDTFIRTNIFVAKFAADGNLVWVKRTEGVAAHVGSGIAVDDSGNVYVTGTYSGIAIFGPGEAGETTLTSDNPSIFAENEIFVAKYTGDGDLIWAKSAGGPNFDRGFHIAVDGSGNAYVTGFFDGTATFGLGEAGETTLTSDNSRFLAKYTTNGDLVWVKADAGGDIALDNSGNVYVTGGFSVTKHTPDGDPIWSKRLGGRGNGIAVNSSDNAYVTGFFEGSATFGPGEANETTLTSDGGVDIFVAKFTTAGDLIQVKRAGGTTNDSGFDIAADNSGNAYVTGFFSSTATFGPGEANQAMLTSVDSENLNGEGDIFVAKFSDPASVNPSVIVESRVSARFDDAEERVSSGRVFRGSRNLKLVDGGQRKNIVGIRFTELAIPQGATITHAYIQFQAKNRDSRATNLLIEGEATHNASRFTNARRNISSRNRTNAAVRWRPAPWRTIGAAGPDQQTPDIASVIQEIVNRPGWSSGNTLAILISGVGRRNAQSFDGNRIGAPVLHVEYTEATETNQPPEMESREVESRISARFDDASERVSSGRIYRGSRNVRLVGIGGRKNIVGMRFTRLDIPQGATITHAYIQFQAKNRSSRASNLLIEGQATNHAPRFTVARRNISSRQRTNAEARWRPVPWRTIGAAGPNQQTPDIASVIQEIVNRPGWSSGNTLAILISGFGTRLAQSFEGNRASAPLLHVEYQQQR